MDRELWNALADKYTIVSVSNNGTGEYAIVSSSKIESEDEVILFEKGYMIASEEDAKRIVNHYWNDLKAVRPQVVVYLKCV